MHAELPRLLTALEALVGKHVIIRESISRDRASGHDRHWATTSQLELIVTRVGITISGAQILIDGDGTFYAIAADVISSLSFEPELVIVEHFEKRTERRTTLQLAPTPRTSS